MAIFLNLSPEEEKARRYQIRSEYLRKQDKRRRAYYWFNKARGHIRNGSQRKQAWLSRYVALFGCNEYYFLLLSL